MHIHTYIHTHTKKVHFPTQRGPCALRIFCVVYVFTYYINGFTYSCIHKKYTCSSSEGATLHISACRLTRVYI